MDIKLSSIQEKVNQAQSPLPLFTCLHVKPDVSELMFAGKHRSFIKLPMLSRYVGPHERSKRLNSSHAAILERGY